MVFGNYHIWMGELIFWHLGCYFFSVRVVFLKAIIKAFRQKQQRDSSSAQRLRRSLKIRSCFCSKRRLHQKCHPGSYPDSMPEIDSPGGISNSQCFGFFFFSRNPFQVQIFFKVVQGILQLSICLQKKCRFVISPSPGLPKIPNTHDLRSERFLEVLGLQEWEGSLNYPILGESNNTNLW